MTKTMDELAKEQNNDAMEWARAFCKQFEYQRIEQIKELMTPGYMVGVFANAIEAGKAPLIQRIKELEKALIEVDEQGFKVRELGLEN